MNKWLFLLLLSLALVLAPNETTAATMPEVSADHRSFDLQSGEYILTGNVILRSEKWTASADYVRIHPLTLKLHAQGNVHFSLRGILMSADQVYFTPSNQTVNLQGNLQVSYGKTLIKAEQGLYYLDQSIAGLSGSVSVHPASGGSLTSEQLRFDLSNYQIYFPKSVQFELFKISSGEGVKGNALSGIYQILREEASFTIVTYQTIPDGMVQNVDFLSFYSN